MTEFDIMTLKEAADYLRISEATMLRILKKRSIPAAKIGGQWRFRKNELDEFLKNGDANVRP